VARDKRRQSGSLWAVIAAIAVLTGGFLFIRAIVGRGVTAATTTPTTPTTPAATTPAVTTPATATIGQASPPPTLPRVTATQPLIKVPVGAVLRVGSTGTAVKLLQQALTRIGYPPGLPDGSFGNATQIAVIAFQEGHGLPQDGIAGTTTIEAINLAQAP
jgi:peptidoglycan hydrolase-like protein with peptidoglycan-binding domain